MTDRPGIYSGLTGVTDGLLSRGVIGHAQPAAAVSGASVALAYGDYLREFARAADRVDAALGVRVREAVETFLAPCP